MWSRFFSLLIILYLKRVNCLITQIIFCYSKKNRHSSNGSSFSIFFCLCSLFNGYVNYFQTKTKEFYCVELESSWILIIASWDILISFQWKFGCISFVIKPLALLFAFPSATNTHLFYSIVFAFMIWIPYYGMYYYVCVCVCVCVKKSNFGVDISYDGINCVVIHNNNYIIHNFKGPNKYRGFSVFCCRHIPLSWRSLFLHFDKKLNAPVKRESIKVHTHSHNKQR